MTKCICVPKKKYIPETGSLNNYVTFYTRSITPPVGNDTNYGERLTDGRKVWVNLQPKRGVITFDGRNQEDAPTHELWMRNIPDYEINTNKWVEYLGYYYRVVRVSEKYIGEDFIFLDLKFLGNKDDAINLA